jgi:hypothetical protein
MPRPALSLALAALCLAVAALMGLEAAAANHRVERLRASLRNLDGYGDDCRETLAICNTTNRNLRMRCEPFSIGRGTPVLAARER